MAGFSSRVELEFAVVMNDLTNPSSCSPTEQKRFCTCSKYAPSGDYSNLNNCKPFTPRECCLICSEKSRNLRLSVIRVAASALRLCDFGKVVTAVYHYYVTATICTIIVGFCKTFTFVSLFNK